MSTTSRRMTADELVKMPDDGHRYELVSGELRRMPPAGHHHGRVTINFTTPLDQHVRAQNLGAVYAAETGFQLATNPDVVRAPDVAFVRRERVQAVGEVEGFWPGAPDLAVEVISPSDSYADVEAKVCDFLEAGALLVVVLNPRRRIATTYRSLSNISIHTEDDMLDCADAVPGFSIAVRDIFK